MEKMTKYDIEDLLKVEEWPAISMYMPVSRIGDPQDPIRYKNILTQIEGKLIYQGLQSTEVRSLLATEYDLVKNDEYWKHLGRDGLAVFLSGKNIVRYPLPVPVVESITIGRRFNVRPLLPVPSRGSCLVLALSQKHLQLFQGDRYQLNEIDLPEDTPKSMAEALQHDDPEQHLQYHTKTSSGTDNRGAMFHGQGGGADDQKENLERYFQAIDRTLFPLLEDPKLPIILAGTEELHAVYHNVTKSGTILSKGIAGNVSDLSAEILQAKAWEIANEYFAEEDRKALRNFQDSLGGDKVTDDLQSILIAGLDGRVGSLFVVENEQVWGLFDVDKRQVVVKNEQEGQAVNLLDEAVFLTLDKKGIVYVKTRQEMPLDAVVCAQLRY